MSSPGIDTVPSLQTGSTWGTFGTAEVTVIANNKGSTKNTDVKRSQPNNSINSKSKSNGSYESYSSYNSASLKAQLNRATMQAKEAKKQDTDGKLPSLFNFMFCQGNENEILDERESTANSDRVNKSPRNGSPARNNSGGKAKKNTNDSDALILQQALKNSKKVGTPRRKARSQRFVAPSDKLGSLDIVMELQQQERFTTRGTGRTAKSPKMIKSLPSTDGDQSVMTDVFDFGGRKKTSLPSNGGLCIQGSELGTFKNISSKENATHSEVVNTYISYRCDKRSIDMILSRLNCSIPLYHHRNDVLVRTASELSAASGHSTDAETAKISHKIKHVCSEPVSTTFKVRGSTYLVDAKKVPSNESIFALLGADSIVKQKKDKNYIDCDVSKASDSYLNRLQAASTRLGLKPPFLIIVNFVVPWGNLLGYFYRPDGEHCKPYNASRKNSQSEKLWDRFLRGDEAFRNSTLKFIPNVVEGPWALKKLVGTQPTMIGQKIPTTYYGSLDEGYLEICMNVTKGGKMANSICSGVASKASLVSIDLAFLLQGDDAQELPEQILSVMRLHHVRLKKVL